MSSEFTGAVNKVRILFYSNLYPSQDRPTRAQFHVHLCQALSRYAAVRVVAPTQWWELGTPSRLLFEPPIDRVSGLEASFPTYWCLPKVCKGVAASAMYVSTKAHVARIRRSFPFDVILSSFAYPDAVAAAMLARRHRVPLIVKVIGSDINVLAEHPKIRPQIRQALSAAHRVFTVSSALRSKVIALGIPEEHTTVVRNSVNGQRFALRERSSARTQLGLTEGLRRVLFVGNLVREKGLDVLIDAFARMPTSRAGSTELVIVGGGPLRAWLGQRVAKMGLENRVKFIPPQPNETIALWMAASDALCLPSRSEGCPNVVLEALASGRPVVASSVGGIPEIVNDANGILVPPEDPQALSAALLSCLDRSWNGAQLRATVSSLSWDDAATQYMSAIHAAIDAARLEPRATAGKDMG